MNLLAIDTSTERASVALMQNKEIQSEEQRSQRDHARFILTSVEQLLANAQLHLSQLDGIIYGRGPGSFTGLRIACSVAQGLAYSNDLPLYPVSSLQAIATEALSHEASDELGVLAVLDARMNELYWAYFDNPLEAFKEQVSSALAMGLCVNKPFILAGVGYEPYWAEFSPVVHKKIMKHGIIYPKAEVMIRLVLTHTIKAVSPAEALPCYIRNQVVQGEPRG